MMKAREICMKVGTTIICTGSKIRDCSCNRNEKYEDPFTEVPDFPDRHALIGDISKVLETGEPHLEALGFDAATNKHRYYALAAIARLLFSSPAAITKPFIITAMEDAPQASAE